MKTITIPKSFGYPTADIIVNGKHYSLKSGEEISVEDNLAEIIEDAVALVPKHEKYLSQFARHLEGNLTEINAEDLEGVVSIYSYALYNNKSIKRIVFSESVEVIDAAAFFGCSNLESIDFEAGSKISAIKSNAFNGCANLKKVYLPETPYDP